MPQVPGIGRIGVSEGDLQAPMADPRLQQRLGMRAGGDAAAAGQGLLAAGREVDREMAEAKATQNESVVKDALARFTDDQSKLLHDPAQGFLNLKGKQALDAYDGTVEALREAAKLRAGDMQDPEQKRIFGQVAHQQFVAAVDQARRHAAKATEDFALDSSKARSNSAAEAAVRAYNPMPSADNRYFEGFLGTQATELRDQAARLGKTGADADAYVRDGQNATLVRTLQHLIGNDQNKAAKALFDKVRGQFTPEVEDQVNKVIEVGRNKDSALEQSFEARTKFKGDVVKQAEYLDAQAKSGAISFEVHRLAMGLVREAHTLEREANGVQNKQALGTAWAIKQANPSASVASLPTELVARAQAQGLGPQLTNIMEHGDRHGRGGTGGGRGGSAKGAKFDDNAEYARLRDLHGTDPQAFLAETRDIAKMAGTTLTIPRWNQIVNLRDSTLAREGKPGKEQDLAKVVQSALSSLRADLDSAKLTGKSAAKDRSAFEAAFHDAIDQVSKDPSRKGKPITTEEARSLGLGLLKNQTMERSGLLGYVLPTKDMPAYKALGAIPEDERARHAEALRSRGLPVTTEAIITLHNKLKAAKQ